MSADRYLLRSGDSPPAIYPGTLGGLNMCMREAMRASKAVPGEHCVFMVSGGVRELLRAFEGGLCTFPDGAVNY